MLKIMNEHGKIMVKMHNSYITVLTLNFDWKTL